MPVAQAGEMLSKKWGSVTVRQHDSRLDREVLERIAGLFGQQICPLVSIETLDEKPWAGFPRHQSETVLCDIDGVAHLFDGEPGLIAAAESLLEQHGLWGQLAIADSVGAAWALSHFPPSGQRRTFVVSPAGGNRQSIEPLPIQSLRIADETAETLARLGVHDVGQLLQLPRGGLATRLGRQLVLRIEQALGEVEEPLEFFHGPIEHAAAVALEYPTSDLNILGDRLQKLIEKVQVGLAACQQGALRMVGRLDLTDHRPLTLEIGLFAPTIDVRHLCGLMLHQLENKRLPSDVESLNLSVPLSGPLRSSQAWLFDEPGNQTSAGTTQKTTAAERLQGASISRLIDSLSARLGREAVVGVVLEDDPLPESAFSTVPLAGNRKSRSLVHRRSRKQQKPSPSRSRSEWVRRRNLQVKPHQRPRPVSAGLSERVSIANSRGVPANDSSSLFDPPSSNDAMRRPFVLLASPIPLSVATDSGAFGRVTSTPRPPNRVRLAGVVHTIVRYWGPERIETRWWKGPSIRRDYFRVETDTGAWWWIFRNLVSQPSHHDRPGHYRWLLHGRFS